MTILGHQLGKKLSLLDKIANTDETLYMTLAIVYQIKKRNRNTEIRN